MQLVHAVGRRFHRRGATIVFVAVLMPLLLGFTALAVDVGLMYSMEAETQAAVDAAALAGVSAIIDGDSTLADTRAREVLGPNLASPTASAYTAVVEVGRWLMPARSFTPGAAEPNAVRVTATRRDAPLFFAAIFGIHRYDLKRSAVAVTSQAKCRIWGISGVRLNGGSTTDSYDSTIGSYNPVAYGSDGDVCSCQNISLIGGPTLVNGSALFGSGYELRTTGGANATGDVEPLWDCINPTIDFSGPAAHNDNGTIGRTLGGNDPLSGGGLRLRSGDTLTLSPGTYYLREIDIASGCSLILTGPTTLYVTGDIKVNGGAVVNQSANPWNVTIYCGGNDVDWAGSVDFFGTLIAPNADIRIHGGSDFYGAAIGGTLELGGGSDFHVDVSLPPWRLPPSPPALVQ